MTATQGTLAHKAQEAKSVPLDRIWELMAQTARLDDDALDKGIQAILESANMGAINAQEAQLLLQHVVGAWTSAWVGTEIAELLSNAFHRSGTHHWSQTTPHMKGRRLIARCPACWR